MAYAGKKTKREGQKAIDEKSKFRERKAKSDRQKNAGKRLPLQGRKRRIGR